MWIILISLVSYIELTHLCQLAGKNDYGGEYSCLEGHCNSRYQCKSAGSFSGHSKRAIGGLSHAKYSHEQLLGHLLNVARKVAVQEHLENGYRVVFNDGKNGVQEVQHLHIHVLGGRQMNWPPV